MSPFTNINLKLRMTIQGLHGIGCFASGKRRFRLRTLTNLKGTRCGVEFWVTCEDETGRSTNSLAPFPSLTCIIRIITTNESSTQGQRRTGQVIIHKRTCCRRAALSLSFTMDSLKLLLKGVTRMTPDSAGTYHFLLPTRISP